MKEQFVSYELALRLKELGFKNKSLGFSYMRFKCEGVSNAYAEEVVPNYLYSGWDLICIAPLWEQAFNWFREKYNLISWVYKTNIDTYYFSILRKDRYLHDLTVNCVTYEEARLS